MVGRLDGKVAVITGGASGMGLAIAQVFVREDARVVIGDISGAEVAAAADLGPEAVGVSANVSNAADVSQLVKTATDRFGRIDVLVNSAGISGRPNLTADISDADFEAVIDVNLKGVFFNMRAVLPIMIDGGGGSIINIASVAAFRGSRGTGPYGASKAGIVALTRCTGLEYAARNVRVNAICPGFVDTPINQQFYGPGVENLVGVNIPLGRPGAPSDIANLALFLASDESAYITATAITIDGGWTAAARPLVEQQPASWSFEPAGMVRQGPLA
jgi:NAD(P)-dependent dehydrogenase (short-subunit alcohol dehydrogenase family)